MLGAHVLETPQSGLAPTHVMLLPYAPWSPHPTPGDVLRTLVQRWGCERMHVLQGQLAQRSASLVDWRCVACSVRGQYSLNENMVIDQ